MADRIATIKWATKIGNGQTPSDAAGDNIGECCTKSMAISKNCVVNGTYSDSQLVREKDLGTGRTHVGYIMTEVDHKDTLGFNKSPLTLEIIEEYEINGRVEQEVVSTPDKLIKDKFHFTLFKQFEGDGPKLDQSNVLDIYGGYFSSNLDKIIIDKNKGLFKQFILNYGDSQDDEGANWISVNGVDDRTQVKYDLTYRDVNKIVDHNARTVTISFELRFFRKIPNVSNDSKVNVYYKYQAPTGQWASAVLFTLQTNSITTEFETKSGTVTLGESGSVGDNMRNSATLGDITVNPSPDKNGDEIVIYDIAEV